MATIEGKWELVQADGIKFPSGVVFTFQGGNYHYPYGNQHSGSYQLQGDKIVWGVGMSTMMMCYIQPPEHVLTGAVGKTSRWSVQGNILHLRDAAGNVVIELRKV